MPVWLDFESYSTCELGGAKGGGSYRYCEHPDTDALCCVYVIDLPGAPVTVHGWKRGDQPPRKLMDAVNNGFEVWCHNVAFDAELWRCVLAEKYGWYWPGYDCFKDTMAMGMITNLPGKLEKAAMFFGTHEKNMAGAKLMKKLCKPARQTVNLRSETRHHTEENLNTLADYCKDDTLAMRGFTRMLPKMSDTEEAIWRATWKMNRRGVAVDVPLVIRCKELAEQAQVKYRDQLAKLTGGDVTTEKGGRLAKWLEEHGLKLPKTTKGAPSLAKKTRYLIDSSEADAQGLAGLELNAILNKSAIAKFNKMLYCLCSDGRIRGMFAYSGAGQTGRWAGRDVQLQNLPRGILEGEEAYAIARALVMNPHATIDDLAMFYGDGREMDVLASLIRVCLIPGPGKKFVCADYSAIEGRYLAWASGEQYVLDAYEKGKRMYALAASGIFGVPYESIYDEANDKKLDKFKDSVGKVAELACGYQGWIGAFKDMGGAQFGLSEDRMAEICGAWRESHPKTVQHWRSMNSAAMEAVKNPGRRIDCDRVAFGVGKDGALRMLLPSGRKLWYRRAHIGWNDDRNCDKLVFFGVDDGKVGWIDTYGGKLAENETQAGSRDIAADGFLKAEAEGFPCVMTVHDEFAAELDEDDPRDHNDLCDILRDKPAWAAGLPIEAAGWSGDFYRKD